MAIAEIRIIVSHKKLYETLASLEGLCLQPPVVITATGVKGDKAPKAKPMTAVQAATKVLESAKVGDVIASDEFRRGIEGFGVAKTAVYYGMSKAVETGKLKRIGSNKYKVVK